MRVTFRGCRRILQICWGQSPRRTVAALLLVLLGAVSLPLMALAMRWLTEEVLAGHAGTAVVASVLTAVLLITGLTLGHFAHLFYFELAELSVLDLDAETMAVVNGGPGVEHYDRPADADRLTVLREEIPRFNNALQALLNLAGLVVAVIVTAVLLAAVNPLLLLLPLLAVAPLVSSRVAESISDRAKTATAEQSRRALNTFRLTTDPESSKELRMSGLGSRMAVLHNEHWGAVSKRLWNGHWKGTGVRALGQLVFAAGYVGAILLVVHGAVTGRAGVGDVVLSVVLAAQINAQVTTGVALSQDLQRIANAFRRLDELRASTSSEDETASPGSIPERLEHGIDLVGVGFAYPETDVPGPAGGRVLAGVDLHLPAGAIVAIVGENGAGKSTLVKLLTGLYEPTEGRVLVDRKPLDSPSRTEWQRRSSAVYQDFVRFEFPLRTAVGIGNLDRLDDDEAVASAVERAGATAMADLLDDGLDTDLGKQYTDGAVLSGGQWQKVAVARGFMPQDPLLLVLDEPTSALDPLAERNLFERYVRQAGEVARHSGGITLFVTHRFSAVRDADLVLVLSGGSLVEAGSPRELLEADGLYSQLHRIQAESYR